MYLRTEKWKNGDGYTPVDYFTCNDCGKEICESFPKYADHENNYHLCWECTFIHGHVDEQKYLRNSGICLSSVRAEVREGKIHVWMGKTPPWELTNRDYRRTNQYRTWRHKVLKRDGLRCRHCGTSEKLQAHHIKPFAIYEKYRYKVSNGLTLCERCHRAEHKRMKQGDRNGRRVSNQ